MPLSAGDKLGPYEILSPIGAGGMGEVYRAHDSRLNRDVAIKVSNAQFTERFTREARATTDLSDRLCSAMAKQVRLTSPQFQNLVDCSLTSDQYLAALIDAGHL
jgi:serine/threonine protein kinase